MVRLPSSGTPVTRLTLGCGIPWAVSSKAAISLSARSWAMVNRSPVYQSGSRSPKGRPSSSIRRWANKDQLRVKIIQLRIAIKVVLWGVYNLNKSTTRIRRVSTQSLGQLRVFSISVLILKKIRVKEGSPVLIFGSFKGVLRVIKH